MKKHKLTTNPVVTMMRLADPLLVCRDKSPNNETTRTRLTFSYEDDNKVSLPNSKIQRELIKELSEEEM